METVDDVDDALHAIGNHNSTAGISLYMDHINRFRRIINRNSYAYICRHTYTNFIYNRKLHDGSVSGTVQLCPITSIE